MRLGMDFWWTKFCEDGENGCERSHQVDVSMACDFAIWFAQQCVDFHFEKPTQPATQFKIRVKDNLLRY